MGIENGYIENSLRIEIQAVQSWILGFVDYIEKT